MANEKCYEIICNTKDMPKPVWLEWRKGGVGGSEAAASMGLSPWTSKLKLYLEKKDLVVGDDFSEAALERMYWGTELEEKVAKEFTKRTGKKVQKKNFMFRSKQYPWMLANIDRFVVGENAALECKTANGMSVSEWDAGIIPLHYEAQVQHYMAVLGLDKMYLAVLVGGQKFFHYEIERNNDTIEKLIEGEKNFWINHVMADNPPVVVASDDEVLEALYPQAISDDILELDIEFAVKIAELERVKKEMKELKASKDLIEAQLKEQIKDHSMARSGNWTIKWTNSTTTRLKTEVFKAEAKDIYDQYCETTPTRKFSYKEDK